MIKQSMHGDHKLSANALDSRRWNELVVNLPGAHILQSWQWGQIKARFGWQPIPRIWHDSDNNTVAAALILKRELTFPGLPIQSPILYIPKGPLMDWNDAGLRRRVFSDLAHLAHQERAIFIKLDPDVPTGRGVPGEDDQIDPLGQVVLTDLKSLGWQFSADQIQFRNTIMIDLAPREDELLANMKQKTRYNVRLAGRRGVSVRVGGQDDLETLYQLYVETSLRDDFVIRDKDYYLTLWSKFVEADMAQPLVAEVDGEILAAIILFYFAGKAWYLYGMSSQEQREKMPNYLLQWQAIRHAKQIGCHSYDLWGAPDEFSSEDSMWGVYRFKRGLGGQVIRHIGAWDLPVRPRLYWFYARVMPLVLDFMRKRGRANTRNMMN